MADWVVNGKFTAERMQGIVRYARELVKALDEIVERDDYLELVVPPNATDLPDLKHIRIVRWGKRTGIAWEQLDFRRYIRRHRGSRALNLCNTTPLLVQPGVTTIHDIMYKVRPEYYTTLRNRVSRRWHCLQYAYIARHEQAILTDSEFSKGEIERNYKKSIGKISVIPCGWQHVSEFECAEDWRDRYPFLMTGEYYFSMATLAKNKNGRWVMEVARRNPDAVFAIAGKHYETEQVDVPANVHLLGFVEDADACALIKNCKAFLYPSLYEGFGLPPLEALALGARVVSSYAASLPEVLGHSVHYADPWDYSLNVEAILDVPVESACEALGKLSWERSAAEASATLRGIPFA